MQSLHVPTLILGHSMAKAGKAKRQSWCGGAVGVFRHPPPGTSAGLSPPCLSNQTWGPWKGFQLPCSLQLGWLVLSPAPRMCKDMAFAHLSVLCSHFCWEAFWIPPLFHCPRKAGQAHLLSPAAAHRSLLAAGGSRHEAFSVGQKAFL